MRIRWEAAEPLAISAWLGRLLAGTAPRRAVGAEFALWNAELVVATVDVGADRVRIEAGDRPAPRRAAAFELVAVGIATVDRDRFAADAGWQIDPLPPDDILGAFVGRVRGEPFVLLEPSTEGRLAATLARSGEGPAAIYLRARTEPDERVRDAVRSRRGTVSAVASGPFGREWALLGRPVWGPHLLIVSTDEAGAATIAP